MSFIINVSVGNAQKSLLTLTLNGFSFGFVLRPFVLALPFARREKIYTNNSYKEGGGGIL